MPEMMLAKSGWLRRWLFESDIIAVLNRKYAIERRVYRHHKLFGAAVIIGAITLLTLLFGLSNRLTANWAHGQVAEMVAYTAWVLGVFVLIVGIYLFIRPSALKIFEAISNRWIEPFPSNREIVVLSHSAINRLIIAMPRRIGMILIVVGACLLVLAK